MNFVATELSGAFLVELSPFQDQRGEFARTFCKREFEQIGHTAEFVQLNHSWNTRAGTLRGLHFQYPPFAEVKLIRCIRGKVFDVIVDIRKDSPTFLKHIGVELSSKNRRMIYVPNGFAHGFITMEDNSELIYHHTNYYTPGHEGGIRYDDPGLGIPWPLEVEVISQKDLNLSFLNDSFLGLEI